MRLLIVEKPSVARAIAAALGTPQKHDGYFEVGSDCVTWALGHLVGLAEPDAYDPAWKRWSWDGLPMLPDAFRLQPLPSGRAQLNVLRGLLRRADATRIVIATDADREGELIARWILRHLQARQPADRLWLSETTPAAIQAALASLRPAAAFDALARAAEARAAADWLVGLNATRAVTLRHGQGGQGALSVGRVQTPTLKLIADRDGQIAAFQATPYWQVHVTFALESGSSYQGLWVRLPGDEPADRLDSAATADRILAAVPPGTPGTIRSVDRQRVTVKPPALYNLADLQKDANRRFGLTAAATLAAAQQLYEARLTTYPRTDARAVSAAEAATLPARLQGLQEQYPDLHAALPEPAPLGQVTDDAAVAKAGHPAILPTGLVPGADLPETARRVFDLVARRAFAALLPAGQDERTTVLTEAGGETFRARGTVVLSPGWRLATRVLPPPADAGDPDQHEGAIPAGLAAGQAVTVQAGEVLQRATKPPARLTDATLLALMEKHGLGTPATRAAILDTLVRRQYVVREKKALASTEKGRALLTVAPAALQSPDLTGQWEARLDAIAAGTQDAGAFLAGIRAYTRDVVAAVAGQAAQPVGTAGLGACPACHAGQVVPTPRGWGCSRWRDGCRFTIWKDVARKTLTESQVKILLAGGTTAELQGFRSKAGKPFAARLKLDGDRVVFVFNKSAS